MTKAQENRFKKVLESKRRELIRAIAERHHWLAIDRVSDPMDRVRSIVNRDLTVRRVERMQGVLRLVEGALDEIRDGTFGACARCGDGIAIRRLEAVPWSPYCVSCQERAEQSARNHELEETQTPDALAS